MIAFESHSAGSHARRRDGDRHGDAALRNQPVGVVAAWESVHLLLHFEKQRRADSIGRFLRIPFIRGVLCNLLDPIRDLVDHLVKLLRILLLQLG